MNITNYLWYNFKRRWRGAKPRWLPWACLVTWPCVSCWLTVSWWRSLLHKWRTRRNSVSSKSVLILKIMVIVKILIDLKLSMWNIISFSHCMLSGYKRTAYNEWHWFGKLTETLLRETALQKQSNLKEKVQTSAIAYFIKFWVKCVVVNV